MSSSQRQSKPSTGSKALIDAAAQRVSPSDPALVEWHQQYVTNNGNRLAVDIDILQSRVEAGQKVLEIGSAPFVVTVAWGEAGVCGHRV